MACLEAHKSQSGKKRNCEGKNLCAEKGTGEPFDGGVTAAQLRAPQQYTRRGQLRRGHCFDARILEPPSHKRQIATCAAFSHVSTELRQRGERPMAVFD